MSLNFFLAFYTYLLSYSFKIIYQNLHFLHEKMPKSAFQIFQNSKNRLKMPCFFRSIHYRFAFWLKKAKNGGKSAHCCEKIKIHIHSVLN
jgi:hypothetical protein